jgi:K+-sensing histidine kinase KdpD
MEAAGQLAGGVAHDFNNLLAVISGYAEMLGQRLSLDRNEKAIKQIDQIKKAAERAGSLTRQLLAFSRKQVLQPKILDLNAVVGDTDKMLRRLIGEHIEVCTNLEPNLGHVQADPGQIEQVLINLAVNARDAMPHGGKLTIQTTNVELDANYAERRGSVVAGPHIMIAVTDTGTGMTPAVRDRIFEPFFTTKEKGRGTGLGLSTVYGIIKQSGGNIWVYSEEGKGTSFKIYLPRVDQVATPDSQRPLVEAMGNETILLVEDEASLRKMTHEILETSGYHVLDAAHGRDALDVSAKYEGSIDLLVTDVVMPRMGGPELAKQLTVVRPQMRVLFMSGYTDDAIVHHGVLDEGTPFLEKPFTPSALTCKIRELLSIASPV